MSAGDGAGEGARDRVVGGGSQPGLRLVLPAGHELVAVRGEHSGFAALGLVHGLGAAAQADSEGHSARVATKSVAGCLGRGEEAIHGAGYVLSGSL